MTVPFRIKMGELPSEPPPLGRIPSLYDFLVVPSTSYRIKTKG